ncbi:hypothetical protein ONZ45_g10582 [Pleurotus djamor]|nr:hypothetical protein ONZ45_g10582 [Pleurotus djamor]
MPALTLPSLPSSYIKSLSKAREERYAASSSRKSSSIDLETAAAVSSPNPLPLQNATVDVNLMVGLTSPESGSRHGTSRGPTRSDSTSESPNSDFDSMKTVPEPDVVPDSSSSVASPSPSPDIGLDPLPGLVSFNLSGDWSHLNSSSDLGFHGSYLWTNDSEARAEFKFRGVAAYLYVPQYEGLSGMLRNSSININLDTDPTALVDLSATRLGMSNHSAANNSKSSYNVVAWVGNGLPDDEHTLVLSLPSGAPYAVFSAFIAPVNFSQAPPVHFGGLAGVFNLGSTSSMTTPRLNEDTIRYLIAFIRSREDLLALGLTNSRNFGLVKPSLAHRVVRSFLGNDLLWKYFIAHPEHAAQVHELEILRENPGASPRHPEPVPTPVLSADTNTTSLSRTQLEESETLLINAVRLMLNLQTFIWDRWVPVVNVRRADELIVGEDIWTTLRDHTQLKELDVVDLGEFSTIFDDIQPIFRSPTFYTLRNLTNFSLKVYYSPEDPYEGAISSGSDDSEEENDATPTTQLRPPRADVTHLKALLLSCPHLQSLTLQIIDRHFYYGFEGNPFTDITSIVSDAHWPDLQDICFWDMTIEASSALSFFQRHPTIQKISCHLSMDAPSVPRLPFQLPNLTSVPGTQLLPNIKVLDLPAASLQQLVSLTEPYTALEEIGVLEPFNWCRSPKGSEQLEVDHGGHLLNLNQMPKLKEIELTNLRSFEEFEMLVEATPNVETLRVYAHFITPPLTSDLPHCWLRYLSKWPQLKVLEGVPLWKASRGSQGVPDEILHEIGVACPNLESLPGVGNLRRTADGQVIFERSTH